MPGNNLVNLRPNPVDAILTIVRNFIKRRKKSTASDKLILLICIAAATVVFTLAFIYMHSHPDKWQFATALLAFAGVLYGTVSFGLFMPLRSTSQKIDDAKDIEIQMEKLVGNFYEVYSIHSEDLREQKLSGKEKNTASALLDSSMEKLEKVYDKFYS